MKLTFYGATHGVTGSSHLLEIDGKRFLLDCGMYQGKRKESEQRNRELDFDARLIDAVLLSHAHMDHSGNLPTLMKNGFEGVIYSTPATRDLASAMLQDSAYLQERDAEYVSKKHAKRQLPPVEPLYTIREAQAALESMISIPYHKPFPLTPKVTVRFFNAGHILGASLIHLVLREGRKTRSLVFTGDLGRRHAPILKDPEFPGDVDYLISESTYGNRHHKPADQVEEILTGVLQKAFKSNGKVLIPAFSVGRTQEMLYYFNHLKLKGKLPDMEIFVDSPLAIDITHVYRLHPDCFDDEMRALILTEQNPFKLENVRFLKSPEDSIKLNSYTKPCIILAGSGMAEGGRIRHHLVNHIQKEETTVLIVGYMAENTLGRKLLEGEKEVKIFGEPYRVNATIVVMNNFSAHADRGELLEFIGRFSRQKMKRIFLVHGEDRATASLKEGLMGIGFGDIAIPNRAETFHLE